MRTLVISAALAIALVAVAPSLTMNAEATGTTTIVGTIAAFAPAAGVVEAGDGITFRTDAVPHSLTSDATDGNGQPVFDTGVIGGLSSTGFQAPGPGTYTYFCKVHPWMKGVLEVVSS